MHDLRLTDAAECQHVDDATAFDYTWRQNGEDTATTRRASARLDRFHCGSTDGWLERSITGLTSATELFTVSSSLGETAATKH